MAQSWHHPSPLACTYSFTRNTTPLPPGNIYAETIQSLINTLNRTNDSKSVHADKGGTKKKGGKNKNEEENIEVIYYTRAD